MPSLRNNGQCIIVAIRSRKILSDPDPIIDGQKDKDILDSWVVVDEVLKKLVSSKKLIVVDDGHEDTESSLVDEK